MNSSIAAIVIPVKTGIQKGKESLDSRWSLSGSNAGRE
jgi:hypothetical protein